ncbi:hypothetical protein [Azospirillum sp. sgz301742]
MEQAFQVVDDSKPGEDGLGRTRALGAAFLEKPDSRDALAGFAAALPAHSSHSA